MIHKFIPVVPGRVMQRLIRSMGAVINLEDLELLADRLTNGIVAISPYIVRGFKGQETLQLLETLEYRLGGDGVECQMSRFDPNARPVIRGKSEHDESVRWLVSQGRESDVLMFCRLYMCQSGRVGEERDEGEFGSDWGEECGNGALSTEP